MKQPNSGATYARCWHYLTPNKRSATPTNFAFIGTSSTHREDTKVRGKKTYTLSDWCGIGSRFERGKWSRRNQSTGTSVTGFWNWLYSRLDKKRPLWVWGHEISQSMLLVNLAYEIENGHVEWQTVDYGLHSEPSRREKVIWQGVVILDDPPTVIELIHPQTKCKLWILDTQNFWRIDNDQFSCKFAKDWGRGVNGNAVYNTGVSYSEGNARCTERAVISLVETIRGRDLGNMRWTASAQGLQCWRHRFMTHKILVHCDERSLKLERDSYFGGNVTLYRYGKVKGPIYVVDYQSFYPSIMAARPVPTQWLGYTDVQDNIRAILTFPNIWRIASVKLNTDAITFPVRYRGKLCCCKGSFRTTLQEPELQLAIASGSISKFFAIAWYKRAIIFDTFVAELWGYRNDAILRGDKVEADLYKLFLNGVPGKLGQRQIKWIDDPDAYAPFPWGTNTVLNADTGEVEEVRYLDWRVQRKRNLGEHVDRADHIAGLPGDFTSNNIPHGPSINDESKHSVPQIAGAITSWGRVILEETINEAGRENVYYTDTDCLHVNRTGLERLEQAGKIQANALGMLSVKATAQEAEYRGVKYYSIDGAWTVSGRKSSATPIVDGRWEQEQFSGWSSLLSDGACCALESYFVPCDRTHEFIPGIVLPSGIVTPITLTDTTDT